ncbi:FUSC family protein [Streptomyces sp. NPDC058683]|uniref:FUSC family protein n=1 Tax=Streptomyces sp. NPDC058683 TaxID=3346597 RepID=UPI00365B36BE
MLTFWRSLRQTLRFDPTGLYLRQTAVVMGTVLGTYGWALLIEHLAGLRVDSVVQAVVVAFSLGRVQRAFDPTDRLLAAAVLPCAVAGGTELSTLIQRHPNVGDAVFVLGVAGAIWIRRFGTHATRAGTLLVLPLVAVLVIPAGVAPTDGHARTGWAAVTALVAVVWGTLLTWVAHRTRFVPVPPPVWAVRTTPSARAGLPASTRMALQMAAALTAAFVVGRTVWPDHWAWVVLTAFLVCSGARSRGDVLVKGAWRTAGAAVGTLVAGAVTGSFGPRSDTAVVVIFAVLAVATWLRELSYAYWAACVTAVLSLLYDWFGQSPGDLLHTRLAGIAVGAGIGLASSWLVLPIRTAAVARARTAAALAGLGELLEADWRDERAVRRARARFANRVDQLVLATAPLRVLAALTTGRAANDTALRATAALQECAAPLDTLTTAVASAPAELSDDPALTRRRTEIKARALAVRRAIGRRPPATDQQHEPLPAAPPGPAAPSQAAGTAMDALNALDAPLDTLARLFAPPATQQPPRRPLLPAPARQPR